MVQINNRFTDILIKISNESVLSSVSGNGSWINIQSFSKLSCIDVQRIESIRSKIRLYFQKNNKLIFKEYFFFLHLKHLFEMSFLKNKYF